MTTLIEIGKALFSCLFAVACVGTSIFLGYMAIRAVRALVKWIRGAWFRRFYDWIGRVGL